MDETGKSEPATEKPAEATRDSHVEGHGAASDRLRSESVGGKRTAGRKHHLAAETKASTKEDSRGERKAVQKVEPKTEAKSKAKNEAITKAKTETKAEAQTESKTDGKVTGEKSKQKNSDRPDPTEKKVVATPGFKPCDDSESAATSSVVFRKDSNQKPENQKTESSLTVKAADHSKESSGHEIYFDKTPLVQQKEIKKTVGSEAIKEIVFSNETAGNFRGGFVPGAKLIEPHPGFTLEKESAAISGAVVKSESFQPSIVTHSAPWTTSPDSDQKNTWAKSSALYYKPADLNIVDSTPPAKTNHSSGTIDRNGSYSPSIVTHEAAWLGSTDSYQKVEWAKNSALYFKPADMTTKTSTENPDQAAVFNTTPLAEQPLIRKAATADGNIFATKEVSYNNLAAPGNETSFSRDRYQPENSRQFNPGMTFIDASRTSISPDFKPISFSRPTSWNATPEASEDTGWAKSSKLYYQPANINNVTSDQSPRSTDRSNAVVGTDTYRPAVVSHTAPWTMAPDSETTRGFANSSILYYNPGILTGGNSSSAAESADRSSRADSYRPATASPAAPWTIAPDSEIARGYATLSLLYFNHSDQNKPYLPTDHGHLNVLDTTPIADQKVKMYGVQETGTFTAKEMFYNIPTADARTTSFSSDRPAADSRQFTPNPVHNGSSATEIRPEYKPTINSNPGAWNTMPESGAIPTWPRTSSLYYQPADLQKAISNSSSLDYGNKPSSAVSAYAFDTAFARHSELASGQVDRTPTAFRSAAVPEQTRYEVSSSNQTAYARESFFRLPAESYSQSETIRSNNSRAGNEFATTAGIQDYHRSFDWSRANAAVVAPSQQVERIFVQQGRMDGSFTSVARQSSGEHEPSALLVKGSFITAGTTERASGAERPAGTAVQGSEKTGFMGQADRAGGLQQLTDRSGLVLSGERGVSAGSLLLPGERAGNVTGLVQAGERGGNITGLVQTGERGGIIPGLAQAGERGGINPGLAQAGERGGIIPGLAQAGERGGNISGLVQTGERGGNISGLVQTGERGGNISGLVQTGERGGIITGLVQTGERGGSITGLVQAGERGGNPVVAGMTERGVAAGTTSVDGLPTSRTAAAVDTINGVRLTIDLQAAGQRATDGQTGVKAVGTRGIESDSADGKTVAGAKLSAVVAGQTQSNSGIRVIAANGAEAAESRIVAGFAPEKIEFDEKGRPVRRTLSGDKLYLTGVEVAIAVALTASGAARLRNLEASAALAGSSQMNDNDSSALILQRRTHLVAAGDTLQSIAEDRYQNQNVAWLIADLNAHNLKEEWIDGKRVIELKSRQLIELPEAEEVFEFISHLRRDFDLDRLVTIVSESTVDRELLTDFLGTVTGAAAGQPAAVTNPEPVRTRALPELVIDMGIPGSMPLAIGVTSLAKSLSQKVIGMVRRPAGKLSTARS
jgi:hypothetical protein